MRNLFTIIGKNGIFLDFPAYTCNKLLERNRDIMKTFFSQRTGSACLAEEDYSPISLQDSIEKTRQALDMAYAGFDNAVEEDLIDSYIYEINALQKRYKHLTDLAASEEGVQDRPLDVHSPIRALVSHVFG